MNFLSKTNRRKKNAHKPSDHQSAAKPTNSINKPRNKRPKTTVINKNSQTCQTHNIFITSLLYGFVIIGHRPPHNKPRTNDPNQNQPPRRHRKYEKREERSANPPPGRHRKDEERDEIVRGYEMRWSEEERENRHLGKRRECQRNGEREEKREKVEIGERERERERER
ncbi:hypothetical protein ACB094_06G167900 [Castanea mollissima]